MSKIGKLAIKLPQGVDVTYEGNNISVTGPKGTLSRDIPKELSIEKKDGEVRIKVVRENERTSSLHGTFRSLIANMVYGVSIGWSKTLELVGAGYRAEVRGNSLVLSIGYSHPVEYLAPEGISFKVEKTEITVYGIDKELVGQVSAEIRAIRPPEPYKGKGIKYRDEVIRRKAGKAAKTQGAPA